MVLVSKVIASGAMAQLKVLRLNINKIGDESMKSFSTALASGALPQLKVLVLECNKIGDEGMNAFQHSPRQRGDGKIRVRRPRQRPDWR
eukprot:7527-Prymnesium_polylepis.1